ncbi:hypothetical protein RJ639_046527 [Escallonia herrerae]|uniref:Uncharacterized protein n=1 Tax=Escallonia herrerae TaxID=1293975 RepID=A0AA88WCU6_9ASTE|nr:hypothetical protein RJ639_046527 [Escallonia herrerae]
MSTKSKSSLSDASANKASPATPRVSKLSRGVAKSETDSPSPLQKSRLSVDRSPRSITSKPAPSVDRHSPKLSTTPDKLPTRGLKGSELQAQLNIVQEDLKKTKEKVIQVEKEKAQAIVELKEAQKLAEESNEKLREALVAQKRSEENCEIEKFRAVEMEQAGIEATQKKEEEWQNELEAVRNQHALDVAALLSATQELQRAKQELAMTCDAKNQALSHADDATKIAEIHAEKVETLSAELVKLKALLDSKLETEANENSRLVLGLKSEVETLKHKLEVANRFENKLAEKEAYLEQLHVELEAAKMAESYAHNLVEEWQKKVEELEFRAEDVSRLERSASESLGSVMKQLEGSNDLLHDAESKIASLKEKVGLLEISSERHKGDLEESERRLDVVKEESFELAKKAESLKSELETVKEEKIQALNHEKLAAASVQTLLEEKNKLINELEHSREEEEKSKKAMESLASALHEVSLEAREAKEKFLSSQAEHESSETQVEDLKLVLKATNEKFERMLDDAKHEIDILSNLVEQSKHEYEDSKADWEQKELHLVNCVEKSEEENTSLGKEISRLLNLLKEAEEEACASKEEEARLKRSLKESESEVNYLKEVLGEAKAESMRSKETLLDKENELQSVIEDNEELRTREVASLKRVEELSKLLEEAVAQKHAEESGELTDSEKEYDMLPKVVEFSEQNGNGKLLLPPQQCKEPIKENDQQDSNVVQEEAAQMAREVEISNGKPKDTEKKEDDSADVEFKMWESCKIGEKDFSPEREPEQESFEEELDSKAESGESHDQINGLSSVESLENGSSSPSKQHQKKKKPLLSKFGSLLKKKGTSSHK